MGENASCTMYLEINGQFPLDSGHVYLVGKDISTSKEYDKKFINLKDVDDVDEKHCILEVGVGDVYIFDIYSSKGTYLNNERLKPLERIQMKNGDQFTVGMQQMKFCHDRPDVFHDSSGFLEVNKNTSDMIASSPESTSQREIRSKRLNNNNFLMPNPPVQKKSTPNSSLVIPGTEVDTSKVSLNGSGNNRKSDSFTIPETQYSKPRASLNASNLSIAESNPDVNLSKQKFDFMLDDDDDEFFIPETQDGIAETISCSQRPRLLTADNKPKENNILEERTVDFEEDNLLDGSQFRINTQDYNEGFGEEDETFTSQIIPIIKYDMTILNNSCKTCNNSKINSSQLTAQNDKEMSALKWSSLNTDQDTTELRGDCATPDIFIFDDIITKEQTEFAKEIATSKSTLESNPPELEDEEDLIPTQVFPSINVKSSAAESKNMNEKEVPCLEKEKEYVLTLSDKENRHPADLEPITDLPPTQLFAKFEVRSSTSTSSCKSIASKSEASLNLNPSTSAAALKNLKPTLNVEPDDEDELLTQAFLQPPKPPLTTTTKTHPPAKSFNSTVLDDEMVDYNPATFFAEMERTTPPQANTFKMPEVQCSSLKKGSYATSSTTSESDVDLLMCTPQLIKEHMQVSKNEDLKRSLLATKHKNLFGDETDEDEIVENEAEGKKKEIYLVELINIPKDTKDFDKLLPHLNNNQQRHTKRKSTVTEEQKTAIEAYKDYKFNLSFGHEHEANKSKNTNAKSAALSRDERHAARDKEREMVQHKVNHKDQEKKQRESRSRKTKAAEDQEKANKQEKVTKLHKRQQSVDQVQKTQGHESKKAKETKKLKTMKTENNSANAEEKQVPARRTTRLKSKLDEQPSTSKEALANEKTSKDTDDNDEISTQPFVRSTRSRSISRFKSKLDEQTSTSEKALTNEKARKDTDDNDKISTQPYVRSTRSRSMSKQPESLQSVSSKISALKEAHQSRNSSTSLNSSGNESSTYSSAERKRKGETQTKHVTTARKRLRSTSSSHDLSSLHSTTSTSSSSKCLISMTMVEPELFKDLTKHSAGLWSVAANPTDGEILVMDKAYRTFKFFLAMARGIPIVNSNWLKKVNETKSVKRSAIKDYLFTDALFEKKHKFSYKKSLSLASNKRLFEGYEFLMTSGITPNPTEIKTIIEAAGGCVHIKAPPPARTDQKIYLISSVNDKKDWHKFRRLNKNIIIISTEAIMSAVVRQSCLPLAAANNVLA